VLKSGKCRFRASIRIFGKQTDLGVFETEKCAAMAYDEAARKHHAAFANPNFPLPDTAPKALILKNTINGFTHMEKKWDNPIAAVAAYFDGRSAEGRLLDSSESAIWRRLLAATSDKPVFTASGKVVTPLGLSAAISFLESKGFEIRIEITSAPTADATTFATH